MIVLRSVLFPAPLLPSTTLTLPSDAYFPTPPGLVDFPPVPGGPPNVPQGPPAGLPPGGGSSNHHSVPEPGTMALLIAGLLGLVYGGRARRQEGEAPRARA